MDGRVVGNKNVTPGKARGDKEEARSNAWGVQGRTGQLLWDRLYISPIKAF